MARVLSKALKRQRPNTVIVMASGGLDSAVLVAELAAKGKTVYPVCVRTCVSFEKAQFQALQNFLRHLPYKNIKPLTQLRLPVSTILPSTHWALSGWRVPLAKSSDESVYLPGWNLLLVPPVLVFAAREGIPLVMLGHLANNPYPDSQNSFFEQLERLASIAFLRKIGIRRPFAHLTKEAVIRRGQHFPLGLTLSCIQPRKGKHCGGCNRCEERHRYFLKAGIPDPTIYARLKGLLTIQGKVR